MIINWTDIIDIILIAILVYYALSLLKGSRSMQMLIGILFLVAIYYVSQFLQLRSLHWILKNLFGYFVLTIIILFQQEVRMALANIGIPFFKRRRKSKSDYLEDIILAVETLSSRKIGAIIIFERELGLKNYISTGVPIEASISYDLLLSIFVPQSPLHDGAVIIRGDKIAAAACYLPLTTAPHLAKELGTRHRAAIGITEETDAIAIVVSEETGTISFVAEGNIKRNLSPKILHSIIKDYLFRKSKEIIRVEDAKNQASAVE